MKSYSFVKEAEHHTPRLKSKSFGHRSLSQPTNSSITATSIKRSHSGGIEGCLELEAGVVLDKIDNKELKENNTISKNPNPKIKFKETSSTELKGNNDIKRISSSIPLRKRTSQISSKSTPKPSTKRMMKSSSKISNSTKSNVTNDSKVKSSDKRSMEMLFQSKKNKLETLKSELTEKLGICSNTYQMLVNLKKKLEEFGHTNVIVEELNIDELLAKSEILQQDLDIDPEVIEKIKKLVKNIPLTFKDVCHQILNKRLEVLNSLENISANNINEQKLQIFIEIQQNESDNINRLVENTIQEQEKYTEDLIKKWQLLFQCSEEKYNVSEHIEQLQKKIKTQEQKLESATHQLHITVQQSDQYEKKSLHNINTVKELKEKVKTLQLDLTNEKSNIQSHKEKASADDKKIKSLNSHLQELEAKYKQTEGKYLKLQENVKQANEQLRLNETHWQKEKDELINKNKQEKRLLEKLTKDRSILEAGWLTNITLRCINDLVLCNLDYF